MILLLAIIAYAVAIYNLAFNSAADATAVAVAWFFVGVFITGLFILTTVVKAKSRNLLTWLYSNRDAIKATGVVRDGGNVHRFTLLTQYHATVSLFVFSVKIPSGCIVAVAITADIRVPNPTL